MADRQKTSQVIAEVATLNAGKQKTSQVIAEVATLNAGKQKTSQVIAEVATQNAGKQKLSQVIVEVAYSASGLKELDLMDTYTSDALAQAAYVSSGSYVSAYSESSIVVQGYYALKAVALTGTDGQTLTKTLSSTVDLSGYDAITFWLRSSRTGANLKFGFKDSGGTTTEITPTITSANTWQKVAVDLTGVVDADKDAISQIIITVVNADSDNTFYVDRIVGELEYEFEPEYITYTSSSELDALLQTTCSNSTELDAYLSKNATVTASLDAFLVERGAIVILDSLLKKENIYVESSIDSLLQKSGICAETSLDAHLKKHVTVTATLACLEKLSATVETNLDACLGKSKSVRSTIDALCKKVGITRTAVIGAHLAKSKVAGSVGLDARLISMPHFHTDWRANKGEAKSWKKSFKEAGDVWGYLNNPNFTTEPEDPVEYNSNPEDEPIIWKMDHRRF